MIGTVIGTVGNKNYVDHGHNNFSFGILGRILILGRRFRLLRFFAPIALGNFHGNFRSSFTLNDEGPKWKVAQKYHNLDLQESLMFVHFSTDSRPCSIKVAPSFTVVINKSDTHNFHLRCTTIFERTNGITCHEKARSIYRIQSHPCIYGYKVYDFTLSMCSFTQS